MPDYRRPGQPWRPRSAAEHNLISEAAEWYQRHRQNRQPVSTETKRKRAYHDWITVKNESGEDRRAGEVLEVFDFLLLAERIAQDGLWYSGDVPQGGNVFGILKEPAQVDAFRELQLQGAIVALVNVRDESHTHAVVEAGEVVLQSSGSGPVQILDKEPGLGEQRCGVLLGSSGGGVSRRCRFQIEAFLPETRTAICSILAVLAGQSLEEQPGRDSLGLIEICDPLGCDFNEIEEDLLGRRGWATYMQPLTPTICQPNYYEIPQWEVDKLCCPEQSCS